MSDMNPYESPKSLPATSKARSINRGIGFVAVLFLTPLAVAVVFVISCGAAMVYVYAAFHSRKFEQVVLVGWLIFLLPPLLTLLGMVVWARKAYLASRQVSPVDEAAQEKDPSQS